MRLAVFADKFVGEEITDFLLANYREDVCVIFSTSNNKIIELAKKNSINNYIYESENEINRLISLDIDIGILAWWPKIIKENLIKKAKLGFVNTHPSLLPFNRGKHYNFWSIVENNPFGVTLHFVDPGIDTGPIIAQKEIQYDWSDTGGSLYKKAQLEMVELFKKEYPKIREGNLTLRLQNLSDGSFHNASEIESASEIKLKSYYLGKDILNLLRARTFFGYPGCWFEENGIRYEVRVNIKKIDHE